MISLDTESTGLDPHHGAKPFLVTVCHENGENEWWEWEVDPLTREVVVEEEDLEEIQSLIDDTETIVLHNAKFDIKMLRTVGVKLPHSKVEDTLLASHILSSNTPHDLTSLAYQYLRIDIESYEKNVQKLVEKCRRDCRRDFPDWKIAKKGLVDDDGNQMMPSSKEKCWKADMWLPKAIVKEKELDPDHFYNTVTADYANTDSATTLQLWIILRELLKQRKLEKIYREQRKLIAVVDRMESHSITVSGENTVAVIKDYTKERNAKEVECERIAREVFDTDLVMPSSGKSNALVDFVFKTMECPVIKTSDKTGIPSLDKQVLDELIDTHELDADILQFLKALRDKRKLDTAINYLEGYERFWLPHRANGKKVKGWYSLYPTFNITGTSTTRLSSQQPNAQNLSKQSDYNLRRVFGPPPRMGMVGTRLPEHRTPSTGVLR